MTIKEKHQAEKIHNKVKNAIAWIDALDPKNKWQKTIGQLGCSLLEDGEKVKDIKEDMAYCCLGVACRVMEYKRVDFRETVKESLVEDIGLFEMEGHFFSVAKNGKLIPKVIEVDDFRSVPCLTSVNDYIYGKSENFVEVRKFIMKNLKYIFIPEVADKLTKHYVKKDKK